MFTMASSYNSPARRKHIVYYDVDTDTINVATHKLHDEFQYNRGKIKCSHISQYTIDLIADDKIET